MLFETYIEWKRRFSPKRENTLCPFSVSGGLVTCSKAFEIGSVSEWLETQQPKSTKTQEYKITYRDFCEQQSDGQTPYFGSKEK